MSSLPLPIAAFIAGLISFLSPCVLPLVPGYVSLISGAGVEELKRQDSRLRKSVMLNSLTFVTGFSLVFITFGAVASQAGRFLGNHVDLLSKVAGVIIFVFGLLHELQITSGTMLIVVGVMIFARHFALINSWINSIPLFRSMAEKFL